MDLRNLTPDEVMRAEKVQRWRKLAMIDLYKDGPYAGFDDMEREPSPIPAEVTYNVSPKTAVQGVETVSDAQKTVK